ncbi:putative pollen-specific leucine-rich repeat extensin-like protein 3 [Iris pallida]|uniref:Pollen-specific leucine-rich repeat extensin-like protein 3 n=1 Tax=Iris pallida TaxID=29817 RepID=A0AAX6EC08_IRIPA|nr:putative pollen-specific leucine-rich repeat extensin-like protein 3 [Iris pallida]
MRVWLGCRASIPALTSRWRLWDSSVTVAERRLSGVGEEGRGLGSPMVRCDWPMMKVEWGCGLGVQGGDSAKHAERRSQWWLVDRISGES